MLYVDFEADSEKDAIQLALDSLGLTLDDVTIESLSKEKKGIFGIGKKEKAKIRVFYKEKHKINDIIQTIKDFILLLDHTAKFEIHSTEDNKYIVSVENLDSSHLIGRNGKTMQAIQNIVNGILSKNDDKLSVLIDVDNYRERHHNSVIQDAVQNAKKVLKFKKPLYLKPLNPYERRLVHIELKKFPGIVTESEGEGKFKKIKIFLS